MFRICFAKTLAVRSSGRQSLTQSCCPVQHDRDASRRRVAALGIHQKPPTVSSRNVVRALRTDALGYSRLEQRFGDAEGWAWTHRDCH